MRSKITRIAWFVLVLPFVMLQLNAQREGAPVPPVPVARGGQGGQRAPTQGFPAQQRPPGDAALIGRGNNLYGIHCRACHGADLRGGDQGGPNLLRSEVTMNDQSGELIQPVVREGRRNPGMPSMPVIDLSNDDIRAIARRVHSVAMAMCRKVEIHNPREGHVKLLPGYTDKDIHDVTAYLVTLK